MKSGEQLDIILGTGDPFDETTRGVAIQPGETSIMLQHVADDDYITLVNGSLLALSLIQGDFDGNGILDATDLDALAVEVRKGTHSSLFDVNEDGSVNTEDHRFWVNDQMGTFFGDANLDGEFNSGDLVNVFKTGEYEDTVEGNSGWAEGDWGGDGDFTSGDLVVAFKDGGYEKGPRPALAAVPEPSGIGMMTIALALVAVSSTRGRGRRS